MSREAFLTSKPLIGLNENVPGLMERGELGWFVEPTGVVDSELRARRYWDKSFLRSEDRRYGICWQVIYLAEDGLA